MKREGAIMEGSNKLYVQPLFHVQSGLAQVSSLLEMLGVQISVNFLKEDADVVMTSKAKIHRGETDETAFAFMSLSFYLQRQRTTILFAIGLLALSDDPPFE